MDDWGTGCSDCRDSNGIGRGNEGQSRNQHLVITLHTGKKVVDVNRKKSSTTGRFRIRVASMVMARPSVPDMTEVGITILFLIMGMSVNDQGRGMQMDEAWQVLQNRRATALCGHPSGSPPEVS